MREARIKVNSGNCCYYISNQLKDEKWAGRRLDDDDLRFAVYLLKNLQRLYIVDIISYCFLPDSIHIAAQIPQNNYSLAYIVNRYNTYYDGKKRPLDPNEVKRHQDMRRNLLNISEFMRAFQQRFSRYLNKKYHMKDANWHDRFSSVLVENSVSLWDCVKYIEQLPVLRKLCTVSDAYVFSSWGEYCCNGVKDCLNTFVAYLRKARQESFLSWSKLVDEFKFELKNPVKNIPIRQWGRGLVCGSKKFIESFKQRKHRLPKYDDILFLTIPQKQSILE